MQMLTSPARVWAMVVGMGMGGQGVQAARTQHRAQHMAYLRRAGGRMWMLQLLRAASGGGPGTLSMMMLMKMTATLWQEDSSRR